MKKYLLLLALLATALVTNGQVKVCQLPQTSTGTTHDWIIKEDSSCHGTKKITIADFISAYSLSGGGGGGGADTIYDIDASVLVSGGLKKGAFYRAYNAVDGNWYVYGYGDATGNFAPTGYGQDATGNTYQITYDPFNNWNTQVYDPKYRNLVQGIRECRDFIWGDPNWHDNQILDSSYVDGVGATFSGEFAYNHLSGGSYISINGATITGNIDNNTIDGASYINAAGCNIGGGISSHTIHGASYIDVSNSTIPGGMNYNSLINASGIYMQGIHTTSVINANFLDGAYLEGNSSTNIGMILNNTLLSSSYISIDGASFSLMTNNVLSGNSVLDVSNSSLSGNIQGNNITGASSINCTGSELTNLSYNNISGNSSINANSVNLTSNASYNNVTQESILNISSGGTLNYVTHNILTGNCTVSFNALGAWYLNDCQFHHKDYTVTHDTYNIILGNFAQSPIAITMSDYTDNNTNNTWVEGAWYIVTDVSTNSFCANLAYYRAQAVMDDAVGQVRLSTNGFGKVTNSNGVSREGMVGIDLSNADGNGEVLFKDAINNVTIHDYISFGGNSLDCYNQNSWSRSVLENVYIDKTKINTSGFSIYDCELHGYNVFSDSPLNISATSLFSASMYNVRSWSGNDIYFTINNQQFVNSIIGYSNTIYLPQSYSVDGWNIGNGNSIFADGQTPAGMSNLTMGNNNTITTLHAGTFDNSNCTFSNNQHYQFSYALHDCNFSKGYLEYKALLSQSGTDAPTATVIVDEVGGVSYSYDATGGYSFSSSNYPSFPSNTLVYFDMGRNVDGPQNGSFNIWLNGVSVIQLFNTVSDDQLSGTPFTIQIPLP